MSDETFDEIQGNSLEGREPSEFEVLNREIEQDPGSPAFPRLAEACRRAGQIERAELIAKNGLALAPERLGGKVALALVLMDQGEIVLATQELAGILENVPEVPSDCLDLEPASALQAESAPEAEPEPHAEPEPQPELEVGPEPAPISSEHRLFSAPLAEPSDVLPIFGEHLEVEAADSGVRQEEIDDAFESAEAEADQMVSANCLAEAAVLGVGVAGEGYSATERPVFATETMAELLEGQGDLEGADRIRASIPATDASGEVDAAQPEPELTTVPELPTPAMQWEAVASAVDSTPESAHTTAEPDAGRGQAVSNMDAARAARRARIVDRLESWLANIRRDVA